MKELVLFDIDGTLIYHVGRKTSWMQRYLQAMKEVYGVDITFNDPNKHEGSIERKIAWDELSAMGITRKELLDKFPEYLQARKRLFDLDASVEKLYQAIPQSTALVKLLNRRPDHFILGLLTGNAESIARWKLSHAGVPDVFRFGLYGEEADDRIALAHLVFTKAKRQLKHAFAAKDVIVIGDTVHDVRCGKAIGAKTILVTTGGHSSREVLAKEDPDLLVDYLMDRQVLDLFNLSES